jgi:hypothetical protein
MILNKDYVKNITNIIDKWKIFSKKCIIVENSKGITLNNHRKNKGITC